MDSAKSLEFAFLPEHQIGVIVLANLKSIVFDRVPEKQMFDKAFLGQFVGDYDFMGRTLSIQISGNNLTTTFPGSPIRPLEPRNETIFNLPTLPGTTIEFKKDESGKFSQLAFCLHRYQLLH